MRKTDALLVGREHEIGELLSGLTGAEAGRGSLFLVEGEPGIGKTRLAEELAARSRERGALVLWSRCWKASGAPTYWPWIQLVRSCLARVVGKDFYSLVGSAIADISEILPGACDVVPEQRNAGISHDPEQVRFRLFEAIRSLLKAASSIKPLVLVLDDLGAADRPSLLLLRYLTRELYDSRILVLAT